MTMVAVSDVPHPAKNLSAWADTNQFVYIDVADNGTDISESIQDKIFAPFFTTRKDGTGVGLSLSRQLASAQGGYLALVKSTVGSTVFTLKVLSAK